MMTGGKTPSGTNGSLPNDAAAAIDEKQRREEHWRRSGEKREPEDNPPRGSQEPGKGYRRPPSPGE